MVNKIFMITDIFMYKTLYIIKCPFRFFFINHIYTTIKRHVLGYKGYNLQQVMNDIMYLHSCI